MGSAGNIGDYIGWGQGQWKSRKPEPNGKR
jgi:hypothetical protein